ncbi:MULTISPECIES: toll/interleukin-1 receptor domain-containing protein [unclassified Delftia]|uniref:toll/interleukin-1 receptor domain-containing protein n=1 Tax=unclassified Delftia TaxID=2613839 RepID=UPI0018FF3232|nr:MULTISPECIES: toll/interleukin-1 receptor domain-containing protein [unclassified Delftia]MBK0114063.1 toll/interleukin-1 receptor domain-containing protein [Delftia sp. S65]MBK0117871.1 toll/interleukin-1 receptor domain-containing protein [Delftia sp. S67]MBK0129130.1 toll/interleukin-1 receptor domain-containing protein [Delftia sp. S66]
MTSLFFSYTHKDEVLRDELETHLTLLRRQGHIDVWHDRRINAGDDVDETISNHLNSADIILLLVSADFISSNYCYSKEMARALERHEAGEARVIPVILRPCDWHTAPFGKLLAAPRDGRAVTAWPDKDEAFTDVAKQVRQALGAKAQVASPVPRNLGVPTAAPAAAMPGFLHQFAQSGELPRSSNLRLKKDFTERDRDEFLRAAFDYVCKFFEGSLTELAHRNDGVEKSFDRIDSRSMAAFAYRNGKRIAQCSIRLDAPGRGGSIQFSYDASPHSGYNEALHVEANDQALFLVSMGMGGFMRANDGREKELTHEGAAELLWHMFIQSAQGR